MRFHDIDKPQLKADGVLVRVHAASINHGDWLVTDRRPISDQHRQDPYRGDWLRDSRRMVDAVMKDLRTDEEEQNL